MPPADLVALLVLAGAAFVRASFGFGDAVLAMPLLTLVLGLGTATPLVGLASFAMTLLMLGLSWRSVDVRAVLPFLAVAAVGIPLGVQLLQRVEGVWLVGALGAFLIAFGLYRLARPHMPRLQHPLLTVGLGLLSGLFGGAYNTSGPFAVLYGSLQRWSPTEFRANLQGFFVVTSALIAFSQGASGLWTERVWALFIAALPLMAVAVLVGNRLTRRLSGARFERLLNGALVALGIALLV